MAQNDYQLLEEYTVWREDKLLHEVDTSVEAFKAEREAEANAWRISKALELLAQRVAHMDCISHPSVNEWEDATEDMKTAISILEADRPYIEYRTISSCAITREFTD